MSRKSRSNQKLLSQAVPTSRVLRWGVGEGGGGGGRGDDEGGKRNGGSNDSSELRVTIIGKEISKCDNSNNNCKHLKRTDNLFLGLSFVRRYITMLIMVWTDSDGIA